MITKLRSANTLETRQYHKAAKALLVLIPLFGLTYLVVLAAPGEGIVAMIFAFARAILLSTQVSFLPMLYVLTVTFYFFLLIGLFCFIILLFFKLRSTSSSKAQNKSVAR